MRLSTAALHSALVLACFAGSFPRPVEAASDIAVLVMSPDRNTEWGRQMRKQVKEANLPCPWHVFFGNADTPSQVAELQGYIRHLEGKGASTIMVVPVVTS